MATDLVRRGGAQRPPSGPPSSLAAATAELFRAIAPAHANPTTTRPTEAAAVSEQIMRQQSGAAPDVRHAVVRRAITVDEVSTTTSPSGPAPLSRRDLDELVDQVVERIEQRVVDELERRGRRNIPEAF